MHLWAVGFPRVAPVLRRSGDVVGDQNQCSMVGTRNVERKMKRESALVRLSLKKGMKLITKVRVGMMRVDNFRAENQVVNDGC